MPSRPAAGPTCRNYFVDNAYVGSSLLSAAANVIVLPQCHVVLSSGNTLPAPRRFASSLSGEKTACLSCPVTKSYVTGGSEPQFASLTTRGDRPAVCNCFAERMSWNSDLGGDSCRRFVALHHCHRRLETPPTACLTRPQFPDSFCPGRCHRSEHCGGCYRKRKPEKRVPCESIA